MSLRLVLNVGVALAMVIAPGCSDPEGGGAQGNDGGGIDAGGASSLDTGNDSGPQYGDPRTVELFDDVRITSLREEENFQSAYADFDWGEGPFERATLVVELETTCFPFSEWTPPPEGERWPADCDAFDRNFEFTMDPAREEGDAPGFEIVRAITPFGGPLEFEVDVTDLANARPGAHEMKVHITTWSDAAGQVSGSAGGWNVTASIDLVPGPSPRDVVGAVSIWNGRQRHDTGLVSIDVPVPEGATRAKLEYRVSGHGGVMTGESACIGPAEEFCRRIHYVTALGVPQDPIEPWREDCEEFCTLTSEGSNFEYCAENPTGAISSVRAPRANWCPGSITPPYTFEVDNLDGVESRTVEFSVEGIAEGGNWRTSSTVYFYE